MTKKRALVTGGGGAIGGAVSQVLGRDGLHVLVHGSGRNRRAEAVAQSIRTSLGRVGSPKWIKKITKSSLCASTPTAWIA